MKGSVPAVAAQNFADAWKKHLHAMRALQVSFKAKHHGMAHVVRKMLTHGAPHVWANWTDEKENLHLARLSLRAHRRVWSQRILVDHKYGFGNKRSRQRTQ